MKTAAQASLITLHAMHNNAYGILNEIGVRWIFTGTTVAESDQLFFEEVKKHISTEYFGDEISTMISRLIHEYLLQHRDRFLILNMEIKAAMLSLAIKPIVIDTKSNSIIKII